MNLKTYKFVSSSSLDLSRDEVLRDSHHSHSSHRGFTLIELLVVIAIIAILSAVVLTSLSTARERGKDAAIKGNLAQIRPQAELYYDEHDSSYCSDPKADPNCAIVGCDSGMFSDDQIISKAIKAAVEASPSGDINDAKCYVKGGQRWAVSVPLHGEGKNFCVDWAGTVEEEKVAKSGGSCGKEGPQYPK